MIPRRLLRGHVTPPNMRVVAGVAGWVASAAILGICLSLATGCNLFIQEANEPPPPQDTGQPLPADVDETDPVEPTGEQPQPPPQEEDPPEQPLSQFEVTIDVLGNGRVDVPSGRYADRTELILTAAPESGWRFDRWEGDFNSSQPSIAITVERGTAITAVFIQLFTLEIETVGNGSVSLTPSGGVFDTGTAVSLNATAEPGNQFARWEGDASGDSPDIEISMNTDKSVTARFELIPSGGGNTQIPPEPVELFQLSVSIEGEGSVAVNPQGTPTAVQDGQGWLYPADATVQLTATNSPVECFLRWGGDAAGVGETYQLMIAEDTFVLAEFVHRLAPPPAPILDAHTTESDQSIITITGSVETCQDDAVAAVEVSGPSETAQFPVDAGAFSADITLGEDRTNQLFFTAISAAGVRGQPTATVITHDSQPPVVFIDFPQDGAELTNDAIDVTGRVSDLLTGFMGLTVTVNGVAAEVDVGIGTNGTFERQAVPLALGNNVLTATATDALGNTSSRSITVSRVHIPTNAPQMGPVSGMGQTTQIHGVLPDPIAVRVTDAGGAPFADKVVTFDVTRSNGLLAASLSEQSGDGWRRMLQVRTDADGIAQTYWRIGSDAGCGNNRVEVTSTSIAGTTFFCASAAPAPAAQINIGGGDGQNAETGGPALEPLRVWVNDRCNGVPGVPVTFTVVRGDGRVNDRTTVTVTTTDTGHAEVEFSVGDESGNHVIEADFPNNPAGPARFTVFGVLRILNATDGQPTVFSGVVLDNSSQPIQGAECMLVVGGSGIPTTTDINGLFRFDELLSSGPADLYVDGSVATHVGGENGSDIDPGSFPSLHFETYVVPDAENSLPTPVLLPPLNPNNIVEFDNTQDVELTVEGVEGLRMIVRAGSMTCADGSVPAPGDTAFLSLNQVKFDKIPMPMPDGAAPPFAWTLQPAGAQFDPPVEIIYPNMSGLAPGSIAYFLSFNHDTMRFEIIATGSVTDDGTCIHTDPGTGISTAGWGCNCPPYEVTADVANCVVSLQDPGPHVVFEDDTVLLIANGHPNPGTMSWTGGDDPPTAEGNVFATRFNTLGPKSVTATWTPQDEDGNELDPCSFTVQVTVVSGRFRDNPTRQLGYDDRTDATINDKSVEVGGSDLVNFENLQPTEDIFFESNDPGVVGVTPEIAGGQATEILTLSGTTAGVAQIEARAGSASGEALGSLRVSSYEKLVKTVAIIRVHEENDDVQLEVPGADVNPSDPCVSYGANGSRDTKPAPGDVVDDLNGVIHAGVDGQCDTTANNTDVVSTDYPTATIEQYLNDVTYNQAVVEWVVTRLPDQTIHFDLDQDGKLDMNGPFLSSVEANTLATQAGDTSYDKNIFLVDNWNRNSFGRMGFNQRYGFVQTAKHTGGQSVENTLAHELGHGVGLCHPDSANCINDPDVENLMHSVETNPFELRKAQWDQLNP